MAIKTLPPGTRWAFHNGHEVVSTFETTKEVDPDNNMAQGFAEFSRLLGGNYRVMIFSPFTTPNPENFRWLV